MLLAPFFDGAVVCPLPFNGRVGVGMGVLRGFCKKPIPILSFPLKGKEPANQLRRHFGGKDDYETPDTCERLAAEANQQASGRLLFCND